VTKIAKIGRFQDTIIPRRSQGDLTLLIETPLYKTRNRLTGETVRGFESHPLRQFKSRCKFAYDGIFPHFPVFQPK